MSIRPFLLQLCLLGISQSSFVSGTHAVAKSSVGSSSLITNLSRLFCSENCLATKTVSKYSGLISVKSPFLKKKEVLQASLKPLNLVSIMLIFSIIRNEFRKKKRTIYRKTSHKF